MPVKENNQKLIDAINRIDLKNRGALVLPALDAILMADDNNSLKKAVRTNLNAWSPGFSEAESNNLEDDAEDLKQIKKEAAKQRVLLGLQNSDENILLRILEPFSNDDLLRQYIIDKKQKLWNSSVELEEEEIREAVLSKDSLIKIQNNAAGLLLVKKINEALKKDLLDLLKNLINANEPAQIENAVQKLGAKYDATAIPVALERAKNLYVDKVFSNWIANLENLPLERVKSAIEESDENFTHNLRQILGLENHVTLNENQINSARTKLAIYYLQQKLPRVPPAITTAQINGVVDVDSLKALSGEGNPKILNVITPERLPLFKAALVQNYIKQAGEDRLGILEQLNTVTQIKEAKPILHSLGINPDGWLNSQSLDLIRKTSREQLKVIRNEKRDAQIREFNNKTPQELYDLTKNTDLQKFKNNKKLASPTDWIDANQKIELQKAACTIGLEIRIKELSGENQHHELITLLKSDAVSFDKKRELLDPNNKALEHLLKANEDNHINYYLGNPEIDAKKITDITKENERLLSFKKLHNSVLATELTKSGIPALEDEEIEFLNLQDFTDIDKQNFLDQLKDGLNTEGLFKIIVDNKVSIQARAKANSQLIEAKKNGDSPAVKQVLEILFRLDPSIGYMNSHATNENIKKALDQQLDKQEPKVELFIRALTNHNVGSSAIVRSQASGEILKEGLTKELSQAEFTAIANTWKAERLTSTDTEQKKQVLTSINKTMNEIKPLLTPSKSVITLKNLEQDELSGFAFDAHIAANNPAIQKANYTKELNNITLALDRLERVRRMLEPCVAAPIRDNDPTINKKKIEENLSKIKTAIDEYTTAQKRIIPIINTIDKISRGEDRYLYTSDDLINEKIDTAEFQRKYGKGGLVLNDDIESPAEEAKLGKDKKAFVSTVFNKDNERIGEFVQKFGESSRSQINSDRIITTKPSVKIELTDPPNEDATNGKPVANKEEIVNYYMNAAIAMIAQHGGELPSKDKPYNLKGGTDKQMQHLWTALYVICEKKGYSYSQFKDSVKIRTGGFNPEKVRVSGWTGSSFEEASSYKAVFKSEDAKNALAAKLDKLDKTIVDAKKITRNAKKVDKAIADEHKIENKTGLFNTVNNYKNRLMTGDARAKKEEALHKAASIQAEEGAVNLNPSVSKFSH